MRFTGTIFVEGDADRKFIIDFVKRKFNCDLKKEEIQKTEGKDRLLEFKPKFQISTDQGLSNILIFDADGSFGDRIVELEESKVSTSIVFDSFLFPNNHDNGDLETLLERIINPDNEVIFACFENFNDCVTTIPGKSLQSLNKKTKIHNYISVLADPESAKERNRDYLNTDHWDLDSAHLKPLGDFLANYFVSV